MDIAAIRRMNMEALIARPEIRTALKLAELAGTDASYLSSLRRPGRTNRVIGSDLARRMESGCGLPEGWMDRLHNGDGDGSARAVNSVPLIEWKEVPLWGVRRARLSPDQQRYETTIETKGDAFAVVIVDKVMEPDLRKGATILVEPGIKAKHEDFVVAIVTPDSGAVCRQLTINGPQKLLIASNRQYPAEPVTRHTQIIGVVREQVTRYR